MNHEKEQKEKIEKQIKTNPKAYFEYRIRAQRVKPLETPTPVNSPESPPRKISK